MQAKANLSGIELQRLGGRQFSMETRISPALKITFLLHAIVGTIFGLVYVFVPTWFGQLINWPMQDVEIYRLLGAAIIGFATSSWLAYRENTREAVIVVVRMELVWTGLGTLVMLYGVLFAGSPAFAWVNIVILAAFAVLFSIFYPRK
jgi:hypothetical protein